jgi:hypothetical protein
VQHLAKSSRAWAPNAGLLVANLTHRLVEGTDWAYSEFASYDLGQAVAHMTFQAQNLGFAVRQFRAFDRAGLTAEFDVPPHWEVTSMSAVGRVPSEPGSAASSTSEPAGSVARRARRPIAELRWPADEPGGDR